MTFPCLKACAGERNSGFYDQFRGRRRAAIGKQKSKDLFTSGAFLAPTTQNASPCQSTYNLGYHILSPNNRITKGLSLLPHSFRFNENDIFHT